jgi:hypothetical protein
VILGQDVKAIILNLFTETFFLARAEARRSPEHTNMDFCYLTANSVLSQIKRYNFYRKWMYYYISNYTNNLFLFASLFPVIDYLFSGKIYIPHMGIVLLDFRLSPCFECRMFSFGLFSGVWSLLANISEHSIPSS